MRPKGPKKIQEERLAVLLGDLVTSSPKPLKPLRKPLENTGKPVESIRKAKKTTYGQPEAHLSHLRARPSLGSLSALKTTDPGNMGGSF